MSDPPPVMSDDEKSRRWTEWAIDHPGQVLSLVGVLFIGVKLLAVSRFQATTALAIASAAGPADIVLAMLVLGYPLLLTAVGVGSFVHFADALTENEPGSTARAWVSLVVALATLSFVNPNLVLTILAASLQPLSGLLAERFPSTSRLTPGAESYARHLPRPEREIEPEKAPSAVRVSAGRAYKYVLRSIFWLAPLVAFGAMSMSPRVWVPPEIVTLGSGEEIVAYVMGTEGEWTTLLRENRRAIVRVRSDAIEGRVVCRVRSSWVDQPSLVQRIYGEETAPRCPRP